MDDITAGELWARQTQLEDEGAGLLGKLMFAFGRLEFNLGLFVRSIAGGKYLDGSGFHDRLTSLTKAVEGGLHYDGFSSEPYEVWINRAHAMRQIRNDLVHGRWASDPYTMCVLNVVASADLSEQRTNPYTLARLEEMLKEVDELQRDLSKLLDRKDI